MALPSAADVRSRLQVNDEGGETEAFLAANIVPQALEYLAQMSGVKFGSAAITDEYPVIRSYSPVVRLDCRPVTSLSSVSLAGRNFRIGTLAQVFQGLADCAVSPMGDGLQFVAPLKYDGRGMLQVSYTGGLAALPGDVLEAFFTVCAIFYREAKRWGETKHQVGEAQTDYTRNILKDYPHVRAAVNRLRSSFST